MSMKKTFNLSSVKKLFSKNKIAKLAELKTALGTNASITVFRKLKPLAYLTSYSHGGAFYTLPGIPRFDNLGLWSYQPALFSKFGTLKNTIREWVN